MTVEEYRNRMIEAFQNADCSNLIALVVLPKEKEFEHLEWLLKTHYKDEQSEDCISRETAIDQFIHWYSELLLSQKEEVSFEDILKSLPSVLPQHKKGKWIRYDVDIAFHPLHCSICGWSNHHIINKCIEEFQFCPNCGAGMRESEDKEMTEKDKIYADELRKRALADYERLDHAINELERQMTPRKNHETTAKDCISREESEGGT